MSPPQNRPREILVVDDSETTARALAELLLREGFEAATFTRGSDALAYLNIGSPSVAVIDIHLPDISGLAISQHIREKLGPDLPIIIISGDASIQNLNTLSIVGCTHFFSKPVRASELLQRIRQLVPA